MVVSIYEGDCTLSYFCYKDNIARLCIISYLLRRMWD